MHVQLFWHICAWVASLNAMPWQADGHGHYGLDLMNALKAVEQDGYI